MAADRFENNRRFQYNDNDNIYMCVYIARTQTVVGRSITYLSHRSRLRYYIFYSSAAAKELVDNKKKKNYYTGA